MSMSYGKFQLPAIRGHQCDREYYTIIVPFGFIPKIFYFNEQGVVPTEMRMQRKLNEKRIPEIAHYLLYNDDWLFSSLTATVSGELKFTPCSEVSPDVGLLELDMGSKFFINDGQHRRAGIIEAMKENPELENETISVVLFHYENVERSNQMFADLNRYAQKPSKSLNVSYDYRDPLAVATSELVKKLPLFEHYTDKDVVSLAAKSPKLFTVGSLYEANKYLLRVTKKKMENFDDDDSDLITEFWKEVINNMPLWHMVKNGQLKPWELREEYICSHSVIIQSLGSAGHYLLKEDNWKDKLVKLQEIDWRRSNSEWRGITIAGNGRVVNSKPVIKLTALLLREKLGLTLSDSEQQDLRNARM